MIPLAEKPIDWKLKNRIADPIKTKGRSFLDVPYGATACACGGKVVQHGHCQQCWDKFVRGLRIELDDGIWEKAQSETNFVLRTRNTKKQNERLGKLWQLFKSA